MSKRLSDAELAEPDIILTIPYELKLPADIWDDLRLYIGKDTGKAYMYRLPAYLARELEEKMRAFVQGE